MWSVAELNAYLADRFPMLAPTVAPLRQPVMPPARAELQTACPENLARPAKLDGVSRALNKHQTVPQSDAAEVSFELATILRGGLSRNSMKGRAERTGCAKSDVYGDFGDRRTWIG